MSQEFIPKNQTLWNERLHDLELVRQAAIESPLIEIPTPIEGNNKVLLKLELAQKIKSFKIRGATYAMASDLENLKRRGVVADSGGNHAQAVALAGNTLGVPVHIVMASVVPEAKKAATQKFGATDGSFELDTTPPTFVDAKVIADVSAEQGHLFALYSSGMTGADSAARSVHSPEPVPVEGDPNVIVEGVAVKVIGNEAISV